MSDIYKEVKNLINSSKRIIIHNCIDFIDNSFECDGQAFTYSIIMERIDKERWNYRFFSTEECFCDKLCTIRNCCVCPFYDIKNSQCSLKNNIIIFTSNEIIWDILDAVENGFEIGRDIFFE